MAGNSAREIVEAIRELDDDAKAAIGKELAPHIPVTLGRRQMLGVGAAALLGAGGATGAGAAAQQAVEPARAADGVVNDIDVLKSGDGTPIDFGNAVAFDHEAVNSATTIGNVTFIYYDSAISSFDMTIPSSLEVNGMILFFIDQSGNAGTNSVGVTSASGADVDGQGTQTIDASDTIYRIVWDGGEWTSRIFTQSVDARELDVTGETFVRATRGSSTSTVTSGTWTNAFDGESEDVLNEFNSSAQFSPSETGFYDIWGTVFLRDGNVASGDVIEARVQNVTDSQQEGAKNMLNAPSAFPILVMNWVIELNSSKTYEIQARDDTNDYTINQSNTVGVIRKSIVHP